MGNVVITGASGLVGSEIARQLAPDHSVYALQRPTSTQVPNTTIIPISDLSDPALQNLNVPQAATFIHCAAAINAPADNLWMANVVGTRNLAKLAENTGAKKFVLFSTGGVYGYATGKLAHEEDSVDPIMPYGESKYLSERILKFLHISAGIPCDVFRLYFPFSESQTRGLFSFLPEAIIAGRPIDVNPSGAPSIQPIHVADVATAILASCATDHESFSVFNLCGDETWTVEQIADAYGDALGRQVLKNHKSAPMGDLLASNQRLKEAYSWTPSRSLGDFISTHAAHLMNKA